MIQNRTHFPLPLAWLAAALVAALALAPLASAGPPGAGPHGGHGDGPGFAAAHGHFGGMMRHFERLADALDLTEEQRAEAHEILTAHREETRAARQEIRTIHETLQSTLDAGDADAQQVGELVIQAHGLRRELRSEREALHEELKKLLTPEQLEKLELLEEMKPERRGRRGPRGGPGGR